MDILKIAVNDAITILQKEVIVRFYMKFVICLFIDFQKDDVTDPPVVLNIKSKTGFAGTNFERRLNEPMETRQVYIVPRTSNSSQQQQIKIWLKMIFEQKNQKNFHQFFFQKHF